MTQVRDRRERFVALAEARTAKVLNAIRLLGNLSNRSNYEFTDEDVEQILKAIRAEVKALEAKFTDTRTRNASTFRLQK